MYFALNHVHQSHFFTHKGYVLFISRNNEKNNGRLLEPDMNQTKEGFLVILIMVLQKA
jgi:hypothetical protein